MYDINNILIILLGRNYKGRNCVSLKAGNIKKMVSGQNLLCLDLKCFHNVLSETIYYVFAVDIAEFSSEAFKCMDIKCC